MEKNWTCQGLNTAGTHSESLKSLEPALRWLPSQEVPWLGQ